jgi:hypothetical protein
VIVVTVTGPSTIVAVVPGVNWDGADTVAVVVLVTAVMIECAGIPVPLRVSPTSVVAKVPVVAVTVVVYGAVVAVLAIQVPAVAVPMVAAAHDELLPFVTVKSCWPPTVVDEVVTERPDNVKADAWVEAPMMPKPSVLFPALTVTAVTVTPADAGTDTVGVAVVVQLSPVGRARQT